MNFNELYKFIKSNNSMFLCGNGFSMNFDSDFSNIMDRLYTSHQLLIKKAKFKVHQTNANKLSQKAYLKVLDNLKLIKEETFKKIFIHGKLFATYILEDKCLVNILNEKYITNLVTGVNQIEILKGIAFTENINYINIEYWTILIYFYECIKDLGGYKLPKSNKFVELCKIGEIDKIKMSNEYSSKEFVLMNGFHIYCKMLFCVAVYNKGKAISLHQLKNINSLNLNELKLFLNNFDSIATLNYDLILEELLNINTIHHIHGRFKIGNNFYDWGKNYYLKHKYYISFSDILFGDYFTKISIDIIHSFSGICLGERANNVTTRLERAMNNIDTVLIFGMNIANDQHIIRNIMFTFYHNKIQNPQIIYSYFTEEDKLSFNKEFYKYITFDKELSNYANNINIKYIKTQDILDCIFYKNR